MANDKEKSNLIFFTVVWSVLLGLLLFDVYKRISIPNAQYPYGYETKNLKELTHGTP